VSTSDPVLYPAPTDTVEGRRQEALRTRAELAATIEELVGRLDPVRRAGTWLRGVGVALAAGVAAAAAIRWALGRNPPVRGVSWLAGLAAGGTALAVARRVQGSTGAEQEPSGPPRADPVSPVRVRGLVPRPDRPAHHGGDVVDLLMARHRQFDELFARVALARGPDRTEEFATLVEFLQRHERVEQEVVHPVLSGLGPEASRIAERTLADEESSARALATLISQGVEHPDFSRGLAELWKSLQSHAAREESDEFAMLRAHVPAEQLLRMATQVRAAEGNALW
jgi:hypothetical protein